MGYVHRDPSRPRPSTLVRVWATPAPAPKPEPVLKPTRAEPMKGPGRKVDADQLMALVADGYTTESLAKHFGVNKSTINRNRIYAGAPAPTRRIDRAELTKLINAGWTNTELAKHFGVYRNSIARIKRRGINA